MTRLAEYANKYQNIRMERRDGILQLTVHTDGGPLRWGLIPHKDLTFAFADIGGDPENRVVILTGTGDEFSGPRPTGLYRPGGSPRVWDAIYWEGKHLQMNLLNVPVPMISAVNGPALRHSELPLLCDIVLAADHAEFQDSAHFPSGLVPGDGMHVVYPLLLGANRGRYFLLTGQTLSARQALELGLVNEVMPRERLLPRAWELAEQLIKQPLLVLRYARAVLTQELKRQMLDVLGYGLALEGLAASDTTPGKE